ncbi:MAG: helix-turn-helix transcriptional regulator [Bacteroidaceae bacterium]|nr:helix-turn-helix transcriptional regulator [Bacteroidaceae bacterium]
MDIKNICRLSGKTITQVAQELGTTRNNLSIIMRGNPTLSTINRVAQALGITPSQLVERLNQQ